jgi:hypothetical protein
MSMSRVIGVGQVDENQARALPAERAGRRIADLRGVARRKHWPIHAKPLREGAREPTEEQWRLCEEGTCKKARIAEQCGQWLDPFARSRNVKAIARESVFRRVDTR